MQSWTELKQLFRGGQSSLVACDELWNVAKQEDRAQLTLAAVERKAENLSLVLKLRGKFGFLLRGLKSDRFFKEHR